jgi:uncharacterized membrane protein
MTTAASEFGLLSDYGIPDSFIKALGSTILPGTSAIFLLIRSFDEDMVLGRLSTHGGTILKSSLSREQEERLRAALESQRDSKQNRTESRAG